MGPMRFFYKIIYNSGINKLLRNINYIMAPLLPDGIKIHPSGTLKLRIKNHESFYLKTNQTSYISKELFWDKPDNFEYSSIFKELIKKTKLFMDIGANIGYYSILGCKANASLQVYAFEPSIGAKFYLNENLKRNALSERVHLVPIALSDASGEIDFYEIRNLKFPDIYNLSGEHNIGTKKDKITNITKVEAMTLDAYVQKTQTSTVGLIKIDTEGAEAMILRGASETIRESKPIIICETLFDTIETQLEGIMRGHEYQFFNHTDRGLEAVSTITRTIDNGVRNCFFVPQDKLHWIQEWVV